MAKKSLSTKNGNKGIDITQVMLHESIRKRHQVRDIQSLQESILTHGLLNPIGVWKQDGCFYLACGFRRFSAIKDLRDRFPEQYVEIFPSGIPHVVVASDLIGARMAQLAENCQREDNNHVEISEAVYDLRNDENVKTQDIAVSLNKSVTWVQDYNRFYKNAVQELKDAVAEELISFRNALKIMQEDEETQRRLVDAIINGEESKEAEEPKDEEPKEKKPKAISYDKAMDMITTIMGFVQSDDGERPVEFTFNQVMFAFARGIEYSVGVLKDEDIDSLINSAESFLGEYQVYLDEKGNS